MIQFMRFLSSTKPYTDVQMWSDVNLSRVRKLEVGSCSTNVTFARGSDRTFPRIIGAWWLNISQRQQ